MSDSVLLEYPIVLRTSEVQPHLPWNRDKFADAMARSLGLKHPLNRYAHPGAVPSGRLVPILSCPTVAPGDVPSTRLRGRRDQAPGVESGGRSRRAAGMCSRARSSNLRARV